MSRAEASDLAAILYTSGTTGRSKGAMLTHDNLASNAETLAEYWHFTDKDVLLHALPVYHTHGLFVASNTVMLSGGAMIFLSKFDADEVMRLLPKATAMMGVPTFYTRLLKHPGLTKAACTHMRLFTSGSAPLLAETHIEFQQKTGHAILERYGMTETNMNTSNPYDGDRIAGTVGFPLPGVELRIADPETGKELPQGETGGIEVKGPNVFPGYWRMPEKTKAEFRADGFFITGDVGKIDDARLCAHCRARQGPDHHRRLQCLSEGNRERDRRAAGRRRKRRDRLPASGFRRGRHRRDRLQAGGGFERKGRDRGAGTAAGQVQIAQTRHFHGRSTPQYHGESAEKCAAGPPRQALRLSANDPISGALPIAIAVLYAFPHATHHFDRRTVQDL